MIIYFFKLQLPYANFSFYLPLPFRSYFILRIFIHLVKYFDVQLLGVIGMKDGTMIASMILFVVSVFLRFSLMTNTYLIKFETSLNILIAIFQIVGLSLCLENINYVLCKYQVLAQVVFQIQINNNKIYVIVCLLAIYIFNLIYNAEIIQEKVLILIDSSYIICNIIWYLVLTKSLIPQADSALVIDCNKAKQNRSLEMAILEDSLSYQQINLNHYFSGQSIILFNSQRVIQFNSVHLNRFVADATDSEAKLFEQLIENNIYLGHQQITIKSLITQVDQFPRCWVLRVPKECKFLLQNHILILHQFDIQNGGDKLFVLQFIEDYVQNNNYQDNLNMAKSMSHELGTNLNSICTFAKLALQNRDLDNEFRLNYLEPLLINSEQLNLVLSTLRDYHLICIDQFTLKIDEMCIKSEIIEVEELFLPSTINKGINIINEWQLYSTNVFADKQRFRQILFQLLQNAVKFTNQGYIKVKVESDYLQLRISVTDTGIGLDPQEMTNIQILLEQKSFVKVSQNSVGSGMGLGIANRIVIQMNEFSQNIICEQVEEGTRFIFSIKNHMKDIKKSSKDSKSPIQFISHNSYMESSEMQKSYASKRSVFQYCQSNNLSNRDQNSLLIQEYTVPPMDNTTDDYNYVVQIPPIMKVKLKSDQGVKCCQKILVVDDEYFNILCLKTLIQQQDLECDTAYNGQDALIRIQQKLLNPCQWCGSKYYKLAFFDINMPILGGNEAVKQIRKVESEYQLQRMICVANSGFCDLQTKLSAFDAGMDYFITKPIDQQTIINFLENI